MKPRKTVSVYVLLVGVLSLLIVGGFFAFQLIDEATKNQLPTRQRELVKPVDGKIEDGVVENLSKRKVYSREEITKLPLLTPTTVVILASEASPSSEAAIPIIKEQ